MSNKSARLLGASILTAAATSAGIALASAFVRQRGEVDRRTRLAVSREEIRKWITRAGMSPVRLDTAPARSQPETAYDRALARRANAEAAKLEIEVAEMSLPPADDGRSPVAASRARAEADTAKRLVLLTLTDAAGRDYQMEQSPLTARAHARLLLEIADIADGPGQQRDWGNAEAVQRAVDQQAGR